jgi:hypothetical protein
MLRKMRKRRIGNKLGAWLVALGVLSLGAPLPAAKAGKHKAPSAYALVAGTVFRENGLSLSGAEISLVPAGQAAGVKLRKQHAVSDARGEFAFRVPPVGMKYTLSAEAAGYRDQSKDVQVAGEERVDVFFRLEPSSKLKEGK